MKKQTSYSSTWHKILSRRVAELRAVPQMSPVLLRTRLRHIIDLLALSWASRSELLDGVKVSFSPCRVTDEALASLLRKTAPHASDARSWETDQVRRHGTFLNLVTILLRRACDERKITVHDGKLDPDHLVRKIRVIGKIRAGTWPKREGADLLDWFEERIFWLLQQAKLIHPRETFSRYSTHPAYLSRMLTELEKLLNSRLKPTDLNTAT